MAMYTAWYYLWTCRDENNAEQKPNPFVINGLIRISARWGGQLRRHPAERCCFGTLSATAVHATRLRPEYRLVNSASWHGKYKSDWALHGAQRQRSSVCLRAGSGQRHLLR